VSFARPHDQHLQRPRRRSSRDTIPGSVTESSIRPAPHVHVEWVEDEAVVLDSESDQFHYLNSSAALVYASVLEHGYNKAMEELNRRFRTNPEAREQVGQLIDDMLEKGLLVS
jgi:hypothetical protein